MKLTSSTWVMSALGSIAIAARRQPNEDSCNARVAVGTEIALRPPHRSRRALLTHRALAVDSDEEPLFGPRVQDARMWQVAFGNSFHPAPC